jgi:hypothetical protein
MHARLSTKSTALGGASVVGAVNLVPIVGVATLGWNLTTLVFIYWIEAVVAMLIATIKILFAERGSPGIPGQIEPLHELRAKRGGMELLADWPPVYPRNIPFAVSMLSFWTLLAIPVSVFYWWSADFTIVLSINLLFTIFALIVSQVAAFVREFIHQQEYTTVSAQEIVQAPAQFSILVLSVGVLAAASDESVGSLVLVGVVLTKAIISARRFYHEHHGNSTDAEITLINRLFAGLGDDRDVSEPPPELTLPDEAVDARVTVDGRAIMIGSLCDIALGLLSRFGLLSICAVATAGLIGEPRLILAALTLPLALICAQVGSFYFRYGTIEYQRRGNMLVAYDTILETPQWIASIDSVSFEVKNAVTDRLLETGRLSVMNVDRGESTAQFGPVSDLDGAVEKLGLPVTQTDRPERDLAIVGSALALVVFFLAVPVGLVLSPEVAKTELAAIAVIVGPLFAIPIVGLAWVALSRI